MVKNFKNLLLQNYYKINTDYEMIIYGKCFRKSK